MSITTKLKNARIIFAFLLLTALPALAEARVRVVASLPDLAALAQEIGGEKVEVISLARPHQDPHHVTATPSMVARLSDADLFVINGLELEIGWVPELIRASRNISIKPGNPGYVDASRGLPVLEVPSGPVDRSMGDVHASGNPHYMLDPVRTKWAAWNIADALVRIDPENKALYQQQLKEWYRKVDETLKRLEPELKVLRGKKVIDYHTHYSYLFDRVGIVRTATVEEKPGIPPSARHISRLIERFREVEIWGITYDFLNDRRLAEQAANGIGTPTVELVPAVGSKNGGANPLELFEYNIRRLRAASK